MIFGWYSRHNFREFWGGISEGLRERFLIFRGWLEADRRHSRVLRALERFFGVHSERLKGILGRIKENPTGLEGGGKFFLMCFCGGEVEAYIKDL